MYVLNSNSDSVGIRKLTDAELDHVSGGQLVPQLVTTVNDLVTNVENTVNQTLGDAEGLLGGLLTALL